MSWTRKASLAVSTTALAGLAAVTIGGAGAQGAIAGCTPISNLEAIIDDSGSMAGTDRNELRRTGLEIFITSATNAKKTLGAVEFGSDANTVFAPGVVGSQRSAMVASLRRQIDADNGGTDYNSGFLKAAADNPNAQARIFLTDGADNGGFSNTHRGGPRTYVVGLGIGAPGPGKEDENRLQMIADETGGRYFPNVTAAKLQTTFNTISSAVNCLQAPKSFTSKVFTRRGQSSTKTTSLASNTKSADLVLNWAQPNNKFRFSDVRALGRRNKTLATLSGKGKPKKLRVKRSSGDTFTSLTLRKPRGTRKLRFRVTATTLLLPELTETQLTQR
jgi:hypothetical protein